MVQTKHIKVGKQPAQLPSANNKFKLVRKQNIVAYPSNKTESVEDITNFNTFGQNG